MKLGSAAAFAAAIAGGCGTANAKHKIKWLKDQPAPASVKINGAEQFEAVVGQNHHAFVKFFAPWCGHCTQMLPQWEKVVAKHGQHSGTSGRRLLQFAEVQCDAKANKPICKEHAPAGYPAMIMFTEKVPTFYAGDRTAKAMGKYVSTWVEPPRGCIKWVGADTCDEGAGSNGTLDHSCTEEIPSAEAGHCLCANQTRGPAGGCGQRKRMCKAVCERVLGLDSGRREWSEAVAGGGMPEVLSPAQATKRITMLFDERDKDNDGLDVPELQSLMGGLGNPDLTAAAASELLAQIDTDSDGSAQLEEVIAAFTQSSSAGAKTRSEL